MIAGRYSLVREIGRGGTGAVWLGRDEVLGRQVALKRIGLLHGADGIDLPIDLPRAEREARLGARLNHPHVVAVFDVVTDADSDARWLVMEYVDGITLSQLVKRGGPLLPADAAPLLRQVADALVAAHAAGIVHRDVKPSNILVDRDYRVKLTDFGIARTATDASLTQTGLVTGSPAYLAPEVASGRRGDESADVWSLGATLFHVLSGRPPYDMGEQVLGGLYRIVHEEPPRLDDAGQMGPLLEVTMVRDPAQRWSMEQVRDFLADPPAAPPRASRTPTSTQELATVGGSSGRTRTPWLVGLVGLALVLVVALVLVAVVNFREDSSPSASGTASRSPSAPTSGSSTSPSPSADAKPTAQTMETFIRGYIAAVASDPDAAWKMLTPKFQEESGGLATYRAFWGPVGSGQILALYADPRTLEVRYRVHFDNFGNGRRTSVLALVYQDGRYLIDGERTEGS